MKRLFSLVLILCLLLTASSCGKGGFDYIREDMTDYYDLLLSEFTGGVYNIELPDEITEEDAWRQIRYLQLYYSTRRGNDSLDVYLRIPEFGDTVFFYYDVILEEGGDPVFTNLFTKSGASSVTIGSWEFSETKSQNDYNPLLHTQAISDALAQTMPATRIFDGVVEKGDIVVVDYRILNSDNVVTEKGSELRIDTGDLSLYEHIFPSEVLSAIVGQNVGEEFRVSHSVTAEGSDTAVTNTYVCQVTHKVEETFTTVEVTLGQNAFNANYSDTLQSLNGKTVYVRLAIARFVDFDVPALDSDFYIDTLGLTTEETDEAKIEEAAVKAVKDKLTETQLVNIILPAVRDVIFEKILSRTDRVKKFPKDQVNTVYDELCAEALAAFEEAKAEAANMGIPHGYKNIDDFAAEYYGYDTKEYSSMHAFCTAHAKYIVELRLLNFAISQLGGFRYDEEKAEKYYETYLSYVIEKYQDPVYGVTLSDDEMESLRARSKGSEIERLYLVYLNTVIKYYTIYQGVTPTEAEVAQAVGTLEEIKLEGMLSITEINVQQYLYEKNTWNDITPAS